MHSCAFRLLLQILVILLLSKIYTAGRGCNETFSSTSQLRGDFHSTNWPEPYPDSSRCIFKFVGRTTQRVKIKFNSFSLQGMSPECQYDYIDIYIELSNVTDHNLDSPMLGRFCGDDMKDDLPKLIISTHNIIIIALHTDDSKASKGFEGTYEFIDASVYNIGPRISNDGCSFKLSSRERSKGYILSPTYPGTYPDHLHCKYELRGRPGERIKLQFDDFSLFHGGDYCPFDYLAIKDGRPSSNAEDIGIFCGPYKNTTVIYSSREYLYLEFVTRSGRVSFDADKLHNNADFKFDRRGFNISYEFSNRFARVDVKEIPDATHIVGTECDIRIRSRGGNRGKFQSPGFPSGFPRNTICRYYFDGEMNVKLLEKVSISFNDFFISGKIDNCTTGYLGFSYSGHRSPDVIDEKYCGDLFPSTRESTDPRMILVFDTHGASAARFMGEYSFLPDFGIPGKAIEQCNCCFLYTSKLQYGKTGTTNTPRHPNNYSADMECTYIFQTDLSRGEELLISFETFHLNTSDDHTPSTCYGVDYLELHERDLTDPTSYKFKPVKKFCGKTFPAPIFTKEDIKLVFKSRPHSGGGPGFKARYEFLKKSDMRRGCGKTIYSDGTGGVIKSPRFPLNYESKSFCEWKIFANKPNNKILIRLETMKMEGKTSDGCQNAVLRIQSGDRFKEICDSLDSLDVQHEVILSEKDEETIQFLTSTSALGAKGFQMTWTEIHLSSPCYGFKCSTRGYCISSDLKCNNLPNCWAGDNSDEQCPKEEKVQIVHIVIGTSISVFFCIVLLICGVYHRKKFRTRDRSMSDTDQVEVRYVAATSGSNTTDRLLTIDISEASRSPERTDPEQDQNQKYTEDVNSVNAEHHKNQSEKNSAKQNHNNTQDPSPTPPPPLNSRPVSAPKIQKVSIV